LNSQNFAAISADKSSHGKGKKKVESLS